VARALHHLEARTPSHAPTPGHWRRPECMGLPLAAGISMVGDGTDAKGPFCGGGDRWESSEGCSADRAHARAPILIAAWSAGSRVGHTRIGVPPSRIRRWRLTHPHRRVTQQMSAHPVRAVTPLIVLRPESILTQRSPSHHPCRGECGTGWATSCGHLDPTRRGFRRWFVGIG
jgi:hypothetical protein